MAKTTVCLPMMPFVIVTPFAVGN